MFGSDRRLSVTQPPFPNRTYTSVATTSINAEIDTKAEVARRNGDASKPNFIDKPATVQNVQVWPGTFVTTPVIPPGTKNDKPPLIQAGWTGERFDDTETIWDLKRRRVALGFAVSGHYDPSLDKVESITVENSGMATGVATRQVAVGQKMTWMPPDPKSVTELQNLRRSHSRVTKGTQIPCDLVPITEELELRTLDPAITRFINALEQGAAFDTDVETKLKNSLHPIDTLAYAMFIAPAGDLVDVLGGNLREAVFRLNVGVIGSRCKTLQTVLAKYNISPKTKTLYSKDKIGDCWNAFQNKHAAYYQAKAAVEPCAMAATAANPGGNFQVILRLI
jgi:hypothetical protein